MFFLPFLKVYAVGGRVSRDLHVKATPPSMKKGRMRRRCSGPEIGFFLVPQEPAQETDPGVRRNHALLPGAEGRLVFWSTKKTIKVCLLIRQEHGQAHKEFRTYGTTTQELLELADWLREQGCTHLAMEATGVYWKPVYNLLEGSFELLVVNAQHIKAVPGRKKDTKEA